MIGLPWLREGIAQWNEFVLLDRVPHAVLLSGSNGLGKLALARNMAHMALCENLSDSGPCKECSACHLFTANNHPDFTMVSAEKSIIKVDQIRKLTQKIILSSTKGLFRVIIVENAEQMNKAAANALLKTLEEPPEKVVIILTTSEVGSLLPTIKSRCVKINVPIPAYNDAYEWLKNNSQSSSSEEIKLSLSLTNGAPITALTILDNELLLQVKTMISDLKDLVNHQKTILEITKRWNTEELYVHFSMLASYFLMIIKQNNKLNFENSASQTDIGLAHVSHLDDKLLVFVKSLYLFIHRTDTPLKKELLIDELLINWKSNFQKS